jgi:hypothetical protein
MGAVRDLVDLLRERGITVHEWAGWDGRGNEGVSQISPRGAILHHTGSGYGSAYAELVNSNQGWAKGGCLANFSGNSDGSLTVLASGLAWHAGGGAGPSEGPLAPFRNNRNYYTVGLEIVYPGKSPMTDEQFATTLVFSKAVADLFCGGNLEFVRAHHEVNGRGYEGKPDPGIGVDERGSIIPLDMTTFRQLAGTADNSVEGFLNTVDVETFWRRGYQAMKDARRDQKKELLDKERNEDNHSIEQTNRLITITEQNRDLLAAVRELVTLLKAK